MIQQIAAFAPAVANFPLPTATKNNEGSERAGATSTHSLKVPGAQFIWYDASQKKAYVFDTFNLPNPERAERGPLKELKVSAPEQDGQTYIVRFNGYANDPKNPVESGFVRYSKDGQPLSLEKPGAKVAILDVRMLNLSPASHAAAALANWEDLDKGSRDKIAGAIRQRLGAGPDCEIRLVNSGPEVSESKSVIERKQDGSAVVRGMIVLGGNASVPFELRQSPDTLTTAVLAGGRIKSGTGIKNEGAQYLSQLEAIAKQLSSKEAGSAVQFSALSSEGTPLIVLKTKDGSYKAFTTKEGRPEAVELEGAAAASDDGKTVSLSTKGGGRITLFLPEYSTRLPMALFREK